MNWVLTVTVDGNEHEHQLECSEAQVQREAKRIACAHQLEHLERGKPGETRWTLTGSCGGALLLCSGEV